MEADHSAATTLGRYSSTSYLDKKAKRDKRRYWTCPCGTRNERIKRKCTNPACRRDRPKRRVATHARTLRDDPYAVYERVNAEVHGPAFGGEWTADCCGVCGKPPKGRRNDRDHDHRTGLPRGLACWHCNRELLRHATLEELRAAVAYLERHEAAKR